MVKHTDTPHTAEKERLQARIKELRAALHAARLILDQSNDAIFLADPESGCILDANRRALTSLGYNHEALLQLHVTDIEATLPEPDAWQAHLQDLKKAGSMIIEGEHRRKDGTTFPVEVNTAYLEQDGKPFIVAVVRDISERKQSQTRLDKRARFTRAVLDNLPMGIAVNTAKLPVEFSYMNDNFPRIYRTSREKLAEPDGFWEAVYEDPDFRQQIRERVMADVMSGDLSRMHWEDVPIIRKGEETTYISAQDIPVPDEKMVISMVWDVTARKLNEGALYRANRALKTLSAANLALVRADSEEDLLHTVTQIVVEQAGYLMAIVYYKEADPGAEISPVAWAGKAQRHYWAEGLSEDATEQSQLPIAMAIRHGTTQVYRDIAGHPAYAPWREAIEAYGYRATIALPLSVNNRIIGGLNIYAAEANAFDGEEVRLLEELASDLAYGIASLRTARAHAQHEAILRQSLEQSIQAIADTVEARDAYTAGHQRRVAMLATAIAQEMGLPKDQINGLHLAATIHDLGKIQIPGEILSKPGRLTDIEFMLMKTHPQAGYDIIKNVQFPWPIADIILQHHERLNGSGYPQGLTDEAILPEAKILAVADVVEAMSSHRPYRPGQGIEVALEEVERGRGSLYDPQAVDSCIRLFREMNYALPD